MAKQVTKVATKGSNKADSKAAKANSKAPAFVARKRAGVLAIEAAGGHEASITIANPPRMVVGGGSDSRAEQCLAMLRKAPTIGAYVAAREKAGLGATLGGYLPGWVEKGYVVVGKGKPAKGKPAKAAKAAAEPAKVEA